MSTDPKPYAADLDDLPPYTSCPSCPPYPPYTPARSPLLHCLSGPLWLAAGMVLATVTLGGPGCVATGPTVSAKADVSVKETSGVMAVAQVGGVGSGGPGINGGKGEVTGSFSVEIKWPGK